MCICNNTGRLVIEHDMGYHFVPCPNIKCTYDRSAAIRQFDEWADKTLQELDKLEGVV